ncbi:Outer mitochondrial membrane transport complex protein domain containing protein [Aphelenchoides fujianensis]|nr:Outer mitochondrial membrane transport complex protein domain containing protein [Aphelenchoides fujianensis]KAI6233431.1 Outer mitochondrial membrane transport complex protein domain containing protein [Aphelenchoides fujianensis]
MTLYVFPPFFDLPSLEPVSLQFLAVSRFVASDIRVVPLANPSHSPTGRLPCYVDEDVRISDFDEFVDHLRGAHREIVLDYELTQEQRSLCVAYSSLIREKLVPALEHLLWVDEYNYGSLTRCMYTNTMNFPNYLFFLNARRNAAIRLVEELEKTPKDLLKDATNVLNLLSAKLDESKYIHGNKPSSLDALLFGFLAPLLKLPLANDRLQLQLASLPNLCIFLENIASIYLPLSEEQLRKSVEHRKEFTAQVDRARKTLEKQRNNEKIKKAEKQKAEGDSGQNLILFGLVSISLSIAFAIHTGLVKFVPSD